MFKKEEIIEVVGTFDGLWTKRLLQVMDPITDENEIRTRFFMQNIP
jgi:hypothetical protein